jgi:PilZ domain
MNKESYGRSTQSDSVATIAPGRERRFPAQLPIDICGFNRLGRFFTERGEMRDVSSTGCKFTLETEITRGAIVALCIIGPQKKRDKNPEPVLFQVARVERSSNTWAVGAWKLQRDEPWSESFAESIDPSFQFD